MCTIVYTGGLRHQIYDILPDDPENAMTARQICERLKMEPTKTKTCAVAAACRKMTPMHLGVKQVSNGLPGRVHKMRKAWWRI